MNQSDDMDARDDSAEALSESQAEATVIDVTDAEAFEDGVADAAADEANAGSADDAPAEDADADDTAEAEDLAAASEAADEGADAAGAAEPFDPGARPAIIEAEKLIEHASSLPPNSELMLNAEVIEDMSTTFSVALVSTVKSLVEAGGKVAILKPSPAFMDAFSDLGLFQEMMKMEFRQ